MTDTKRPQITGCVDGSFRDRIAAAIKSADKRVAGFISYEERADAVIAALGLREECSIRYTPKGNGGQAEIQEWSCGHERIGAKEHKLQELIGWLADFPEEQPHVVTRYVTEWTTDE